MSLKLRPERRLPLLLHILAWVIILILPRYLVHAFGDGDMVFLRHYYLNTVSYGLIFYLNYLVLVPRLYFKEKRLLYFGLIVVLLAGFTLLLTHLNNLLFDLNLRESAQRAMEAGRQVERPPRGERSGRHTSFQVIGIISHLTTFMLVSGFSLGLGVLDRFRKNEKERKEMEKEMLNTELALLKNQVSPHFLFNTLNNIYSLIQFDSKKAAETVHKLSKLMRYLLYDSDKSLASLSDELHFMRNYIELMQLRINDKVRLEIELPEEVSDIKLPPLIFIPVIENAFKHGVSYREASFIEITLKVKEDEVLFRTRNSLVGGSPEHPLEHSGIGMENVRKRLKLLFPERHTFDIVPGEDDFLVEIHLNTAGLEA